MMKNSKYFIYFFEIKFYYGKIKFFLLDNWILEWKLKWKLWFKVKLIVVVEICDYVKYNRNCLEFVYC